MYLTEEGKKAIEDKIVELEIWSERNGRAGDYDSEGQVADELKSILSSAIVLPVEDAWHRTYGKNNWMEYPNGVIIERK